MRNAIKATLQQTPSAQITLTDVKLDNDKATVNYQAKDNGKNSVLLLALIEKTAVSNVKAGENKGRSLAHVQIVRQLQTVILTDGGSGIKDITLPTGFTPKTGK
ncbi:DUF1223 domain-containing protein [Mucilaginibacter antarcticus]|uniref:DUF1223 domain-containing protein n=1 Tax=Mucilaginibacter antarcticus TaxID=1855725 RepID=UPI0036442432